MRAGGRRRHGYGRDGAPATDSDSGTVVRRSAVRRRGPSEARVRSGLALFAWARVDLVRSGQGPVRPGHFSSGQLTVVEPLWPMRSTQ
ncbi:hypothetical protein STENM223S_09190 [Streptomyces tendae]